MLPHDSAFRLIPRDSLGFRAPEDISQRGEGSMASRANLEGCLEEGAHRNVAPGTMDVHSARHRELPRGVAKVPDSDDLH